MDPLTVGGLAFVLALVVGQFKGEHKKPVDTKAPASVEIPVNPEDPNIKKKEM